MISRRACSWPGAALVSAGQCGACAAPAKHLGWPVGVQCMCVPPAPAQPSHTHCTALHTGSVSSCGIFPSPADCQHSATCVHPPTPPALPNPPLHIRSGHSASQPAHHSRVALPPPPPPCCAGRMPHRHTTCFKHPKAYRHVSGPMPWPPARSRASLAALPPPVKPRPWRHAGCANPALAGERHGMWCVLGCVAPLVPWCCQGVWVPCC